LTTEQSNDSDFDVTIAVGGDRAPVAPHQSTRVTGRRSAGEIGPTDYERALALTSPAASRTRSEVVTGPVDGYGNPNARYRRPSKPVNVTIQDFGDAHKIAFLTPQNRGNTIGHLIWDTTSGKIKDIRVVSEHRNNGAAAMRLLDDAWTHSAEYGHAGPTGGDILPPAAWGAQRTLNPEQQSFKEHPFTSGGAVPGIGKFMHAPLSQEEYNSEYATPLLNHIQQYYENKATLYARRTETAASENTRSLRSATASQFEDRREKFDVETTGRLLPQKLKTEFGARDLSLDEYQGNLPSGAEIANRVLLNNGRAEDIDSIPKGACEGCGGRGVDKLVARIDPNVDVINHEFVAEHHPDYRDDEYTSFKHPRAGRNTTVSSLKDLRTNHPQAVISVGQGSIMVEKPCTMCQGTGTRTDG